MSGELRTLYLRCYAELNDFLPQERRHKAWPYRVSANVSIQDLISALSLPAEGIALVLVDGRREGLDYIPEDRARITLYPDFRATGLLSGSH